MKNKKVFIVTYGCPKNTCDSENIAFILKENGYGLARGAEDADIIIINTCTFIDDAKTESVEGILEACLLKKENPNIKIAVCGCLAQRYAEELKAELPEADLFVGTSEIYDLPALLNSNEKTALGDIDKTPPETGRINLGESGVSAYIKISEGCNKYCSYCIIPYIKGKLRSRAIEDIVSEAEALAENGTKELVLVSQDVGEYGSDLYGKRSLSELIRRLEQIEKLRWLRLLYVYPETIDDEFIVTLRQSKKTLRYIDIPFQHISDRVLKNMNRAASGQSIRSLIARLREAMPDIAIRSSFITGFPGETENDVEELNSFFKEARLTRCGVFKYSREEGTPAYGMDGQISEEIKQKRCERLMQTLADISAQVLECFVGKTLDVLIEERIEDNLYIGRSYLDAPDIDGCVFVTSDKKIKIGSIVPVGITGSTEYDLNGRSI